MKEGRLTDDERRSYLATAVKHSEQLGKLVAALFELAKLDSPDVQVRTENFSLDELIQDILQKYRLAAELKHVNLGMDVENDLPHVQADIGLIERVFENLIDNALRYTPMGGAIHIEARHDQDRVSVRVCDTGTGIASEVVPHLFDRYYRRDRSRKDPNAGSGLGLIIAKRILELHGSDIAVTSVVNSGTTLTFTLPRSRSIS
jgi:signal transduction histidine kinase